MSDINDYLKYVVTFKSEDGSTVSAGELVIDTSVPGSYRADFRYDKNFMETSKFPDICPVTLPRKKGVFHTILRPDIGLPFGIQDSLPDSWGKAVISRTFDLSPLRATPPFMLKYVRHPLGALSYTLLDDPKPLQKVGKLSLEEKIIEVLEFAAGKKLDQVHLDALAADSSSGGARPKLCHRDESGREWIVKPVTPKDSFPLISAELLCGDAAYMLGLVTEKSRIANFGGVDVLFVPRFDTVGTAGRRHLLTMKSLMGRESNLDGTYEGMADLLVQIGAQPDEDRKRLFRQALLNCAVGNVDDHLKNFSATWALSEGWRLSPAYDITPAVMMNAGHGGEWHSIGFFKQEPAEISGRAPQNSDAFLELGKRMGLTTEQAVKSVDSVVDAVEWLKSKMPDYGIDGQDAIAWREIIDSKLVTIKSRKGRDCVDVNISDDKSNRLMQDAMENALKWVGENDGKPVDPVDLAAGRYSGTVLYENQSVIVQNLGYSVAIHAKTRLNMLPKEGEMASIVYKSGCGFVEGVPNVLGGQDRLGKQR